MLDLSKYEVSRGHPRTVDGAKAALRRYEDQNQDLPPSTARLLGLAAIGRYFGRTILEAAMEQKLPYAVFRDHSWRWWNVLSSAGLGDHWDAFAKTAQTLSISHACRALRHRCRPDQYDLLLRRAGINPDNTHRRRHAASNIVWTRGGVWRAESPFTTILVRKKHLPERRRAYWWQQKLGQDGVRMIERELMHLIDPEKILRHEAKDRAIEYVRRRISELVGRQKVMTYKVCAWFFQVPILRPRDGAWLVPGPDGLYIREHFGAYRHSWEW